MVLSLASEEQTVFLLVQDHREFLREFLFIGALIGWRKADCPIIGN
jgi:hypothetical protein